MKNNFFYKLIFLFILNFIYVGSSSSEQFNFNIKEIEILNNGNLYKGIKGGTITTNDGLEIEANTFIYNKITNIVNAEGNVKVKDVVNNYLIFSDTATYKKNDEIVIAEGNAKGIDDKDRIITSKKITYNKITNIVNAEGNVKVKDVSEDYTINAEELLYFQKNEKISTIGATTAAIKSKYNIESQNLSYLMKNKELSSKKKSIIKDNNNQIYYLDEFVYYVNANQLKGKNILTITNFKLPKSDKFFFKDGMFNLENKKFTASDTKINVHKNIFNNSLNDPRIYGISSLGDNEKTLIKKGYFTICEKREGCPPWSIKSEEIEHDKIKRQIRYKNAVVQLYDFPVFYFPKFFHPDPSVIRQSGLLRPEINKSNVLGSSITQPYFHVISENKDYTFSPTWFDNDIFSFQNEYRQANKNSEFIADFGFVNGYKNNNRSHLFANYDLDLKLDNFIDSKLFVQVEQVSNDTYLKVFDTHITKSSVRPDDLNSMNNKIDLLLNHEEYTFNTGFNIYENLNVSKNSDRYQYVLPYYNFDKVLTEKFFNGSISLNSSGDNNLKDTNKLTSTINNNLNYSSDNYITKSGFNNNYNFYLKNFNSLGNSNSAYKSSPDIELVSLFEATSSLPLIKNEENYNNYLTPKISFRVNPSDMSNNASGNRIVDIGNVFSTNRLGLSDTFESGRSLTVGVDYKKEKTNLDDINNFFEIKLATVFRDKVENFIPNKSTLHRKTSNIFGSVSNNLSNNYSFNYKFALDNDLNTFEYNQFNTTLIFNKLTTEFSFTEENGEMGESNVFGTSLSYEFNDENFLTFQTRRNRKVNLTEYYDLVYEYKNDCLTAGIKYKKTYYEDRDIKPTENLLFTITLFPLTTYEHNASDLINN